MEKITAGHPLSQSEDIVKQNIDTLKALFPTIVKEGKIDIGELKALLGEDVEENEEYYRFVWAGKSQARQEANKPSTGTLRPNKLDSVDWDDTENIFIEGDNLEVLKLLQKSYSNSVKVIYIDPPYNTGNDFVYNDNYSDNLTNYLTLTGQTDEQGKKIATNTESNGRFHSNWLNMIYPRLKLARNLLKEDGVIFISIDDNEVSNLRKLCDEIFGEENFISQIIWEGALKNDSKFVSLSHDYILCYCKSKEHLRQLNTVWRTKKEGVEKIYKAVEDFKLKLNNDYKAITDSLKKWYFDLDKSDPAKQHKHYNRVDERGVYFPSDISWPGGGGPTYEVIHPLTKKPVKKPSRGWIYPKKETMDSVIDNNRVDFGDDETKVPTLKKYLSETEGQVLPSVIYKDRRAAMQRLRTLMDGDLFENPKDEEVIKKLIEAVTFDNERALVVDFFAGSGTTAHAVMKLNAENGSNRKFISVQLPEKLDENSEGYKSGYVTIADITKERIKRAGILLQGEQKEDLFSEQGYILDTGFKAFKLNSSNINGWDGSTENFEQNIFESINNIKTGRTQEDLLYEILLKKGLPLTLPITEKAMAGKKVFNIGLGALFICLADNISTAVAEGIGQWKAELSPATCTVIFKDAGLTDVEKANSIQILKRYGITEVNSI